MQEILEEFFVEAEESLDDIEQDLIKLEALSESGEQDSEVIDRLFRGVHTLKGGAGFLGLDKMAQLAHAGENLMDEVRSDKIVVNKGVMDALLKTNDLLRNLVDINRAGGDASSIDTTEIVTKLEKLAGAEVGVAIKQKTKSSTIKNGATKHTAKKPNVSVNKELLEEIMADERLEPKVGTAVIDTSIEIKRGDSLKDRREDERRQGADERRKNKRRKAERKDNSIRVETSRLDSIMNMVGELVLSRNALIQQVNHPTVKAALGEAHAVDGINDNIEALSKAAHDLQIAVLGIRMQPIKKVFDKIPRQVRELKSDLGKNVSLIIEGEDTEIDKTLVEEIADPMVHLIRNALDHGIESPEERITKGKPPQATLTVRAFCERNHIVIEVEDDGAGINHQKIKDIAINKGIISEDEAASIADSDALHLIFSPGFSTAEQISDISGRGVGMDVVHSKIAAVKGRIDIGSELDVGTKISIHLPLTLAIMDILVVAAEKKGFAIPVNDTFEVTKFNKKEAYSTNDGEAIDLRGEELPLFYLSDLINNKKKPGDKDGAFFVVVREGDASLGIVIDELKGQEEAVVKPVTDIAKFDKGVSGDTITRDGAVHMMLDIPFLLKNKTQHNKE
jgi:two-component system chemotaxis sensor kinase CheA